MTAFSSTQKAVRVALMFMALCACSDEPDDDGTVEVSIKPGVDFTKYHTFRIVDQVAPGAADAGTMPPTIPADVKVNIDVANDQARIELKLIGLTEAAAGQDADLGVFSLGTKRQQIAEEWVCVPGSWYGYWGYTWDPCAWLEPIYYEYTEGTVALGLADPKLQAVVFGGVMKGVLESTDGLEQRVRAGVETIFDAYPAKPSP